MPPAQKLAHLQCRYCYMQTIWCSHTQIGLKRLVYSCSQYLAANNLLLNSDKSNVMVYGKRWKPRLWLFNGNHMQQVKTFLVLSINFHYNHHWASQHTTAIKSAQINSQAICRFFFFYTHGCSFIPAALNIFRAKIVSQLLYGVQLWLLPFNTKVERIQSCFCIALWGCHVVSRMLPSVWRWAKSH